MDASPAQQGRLFSVSLSASPIRVWGDPATKVWGPNVTHRSDPGEEMALLESTPVPRFVRRPSGDAGAVAGNSLRLRMRQDP